jgi:hypothetical protein
LSTSPNQVRQAIQANNFNENRRLHDRFIVDKKVMHRAGLIQTPVTGGGLALKMTLFSPKRLRI